MLVEPQRTVLHPSGREASLQFLQAEPSQLETLKVDEPSESASSALEEELSANLLWEQSALAEISFRATFQSLSSFHAHLG